jgi:DNA-3-methyladenine glycosylase I
LDKIIEIDDDYFDELMNNDKIVKNKLKIKSVIKNANACKEIIEEFGSLSDYFWSFVDGDVIKNEFEKLADIPSETDISKAMSKDLKKR